MIGTTENIAWQLATRQLLYPLHTDLSKWNILLHGSSTGLHTWHAAYSFLSSVTYFCGCHRRSLSWTILDWVVLVEQRCVGCWHPPLVKSGMWQSSTIFRRVEAFNVENESIKKGIIPGWLVTPCMPLKVQYASTVITENWWQLTICSMQQVCVMQYCKQ